jgi:hypothetical protein
MKFKILSISRHSEYKRFILQSKNNCVRRFFEQILKEKSELVDCKIQYDGLAKFRMDDHDIIEYRIETETHDRIRSVFKKHLMKKRNSELITIKDKIDNLRKLFLESMTVHNEPKICANIGVDES